MLITIYCDGYFYIIYSFYSYSCTNTRFQEMEILLLRIQKLILIFVCLMYVLFIYRILFYIVILVQFINYPEAQSILLSMLSFMYLIYLVKFEPLQSPFEFFQIIYRPLLIMIITCKRNRNDNLNNKKDTILIINKNLQYLIIKKMNNISIFFLIGFNILNAESQILI
ncbi:unnamed protein product [Paramecium primaurelia]|uniref:Transmembrane protein n=1 Tax=Paramecium primaurelia TaxID=5886 RepID=A0A8S1QGU3_PARPR|nr:unnamed protein product [Paramecium primaurelia]